MKDCYHNTCDNAAHNVSHHFASMDMLVKVTQTIIDLLLGRIHVFITENLSKVLMYLLLNLANEHIQALGIYQIQCAKSRVLKTSCQNQTVLNTVPFQGKRNIEWIKLNTNT